MHESEIRSSGDTNSSQEKVEDTTPGLLFILRKFSKLGENYPRPEDMLV